VFWSREDWAPGVSLMRDALSRLGVAAGALVAVAVADDLVTAAVEGLGAQALPARDGWDWSGWPVDVVVTTPFAALALPRLPSLRRVILTGAVGASPELAAVVRRRQERDDIGCGEYYGVAESPGPLAASCPAGRLHPLPDGPQLALAPLPGEPPTVGRVLVTDVRERAGSLDAFDTGDVAEAGGCGCGTAGSPVLRRILGRSRSPMAGGRYLWPADLVRALLRTPGFGGRAVARLRRDRGRDREFLYVWADVEAGMEADAVRGALDYSLSAVCPVPVRVEVRPLDGPPGLDLADERMR
jgi:hypothetical protein